MAFTLVSWDSPNYHHKTDMATKSPKLVGMFVAGVLAAFPLIATILLIAFVVGIIIDWLGPTSIYVSMGLTSPQFLSGAKK
jgi:uncharacterized membrane protein